MHKGWLLVKPKFRECYETNRLVEEFQNNKINVKIIDPNEIDIFVNKDNKNLRVMDLTAITLCKENKLPIQVFNINNPGDLIDIMRGVKLGTTVGE